MPAALPYSKQTPGRTFVVAMSVLALVAVMEVGALGWAFSQRLKQGAPLFGSQGAIAKFGLGRAHRAAGTFPVRPDGLNDPFNQPAPPAPPKTLTGPIMPPPKPQPVLQARVDPAPETRFAELMQQGKLLRERGDTANSLVRFREAYALDQRNPAALTELALTYEKMGLADKAAEQWKRIFDLGESAGVYFTAAEAKMRQAMMAAQSSVLKADPNAAGAPAVGVDATLGLGAIASEELNDPKVLRRFVLRVPIQMRIPVKLNVKDVVIQVLFYDLVDDKPQRTNATVNNRFSSAPVDWRDEEAEVLEVEYTQPNPDVRDPKREDRKYFGYIVRLYYKDELQATRAEPPLLGQKFPASQTLEKTAAP